MSQVWKIPLETTQTLSSSRADINDAFDSLQTHFIGASDPSSIDGGLEDGMVWINTTSDTVKARKSAATITLLDFVDGCNIFKKDGTVTATGAFNMGTFKVTNMGTPTATGDAATKAYVDGFVPLAGGTMTGLLTLSGAPTAGNHAATRTYADLKVAKTGDTMTGTLAVPTGSKSAQHALRRDEVEDLLTFNTSTGHRHDGTDARKIRGSDIDHESSTDGQVLRSTGSAMAFSNAPRIAFGTYTGDNTTDRTISLPWTPDWVVVQEASGCMYLGNLEEPGGTVAGYYHNLNGNEFRETFSNEERPQKTTNGFIVSGSGDISGAGGRPMLNKGSVTFTYIAFKAE